MNAVQWILSHNNVLHVSNQSSLQLVDGHWKMEDAVIVICDGDITWLSDFILDLLPSSVALNSLRSELTVAVGMDRKAESFVI